MNWVDPNNRSLLSARQSKLGNTTFCRVKSTLVKSRVLTCCMVTSWRSRGISLHLFAWFDCIHNACWQCRSLITVFVYQSSSASWVVMHVQGHFLFNSLVDLTYLPNTERSSHIYGKFRIRISMFYWERSDTCFVACRFICFCDVCDTDVLTAACQNLLSSRPKCHGWLRRKSALQQLGSRLEEKLRVARKNSVVNRVACMWQDF